MPGNPNPASQPAPGAAWQMQPQNAMQQCSNTNAGDASINGADTRSVQDAKRAAQRMVDQGYDGGEGQGSVRDARVEDFRAPTTHS